MAYEHDDRTPIIASNGGLQSGDVSVAVGKGLSSYVCNILDPRKILRELIPALNEFKCTICQLTAPYEVFSTEPPKKCSRKIRFREKCYSMLDPFRPPNQRLPLVVGGQCSGTETIVHLSLSY